MNSIFMVLVLLAMVEDLKPLDRLLLNNSIVNVRSQYNINKGKIRYNSIDPKDLWQWKDPAFDFDVSTKQDGSWGMEGKTERFEFNMPSRAKEGDEEGQKKLKAERVLLLYDGETFATTTESGHVIEAAKATEPLEAAYARGPYHCWGHTFASVLKEFQGLEPDRISTTIYDQPVQIEIYRRNLDESGTSFYQLEIYYLLNYNCIPKYMRRILVRPNLLGTIQERYITKIFKTSNGAYLPTEIAEYQLTVGNFRKRFPNYTFETDFAFRMSVDFSLLKFDRIKESTFPLTLRTASSGIIATPGGVVPLKAQMRNLTLNQIKASVGTKISEQNQSLPNLDTEELNVTYEHYNMYKILVFILIAVAILLIVAKKLSVGIRKYLILFFLIGLVGCNSKSQGPKLRAFLDKSSVLYNQGGEGGPSTLTVANDGTEEVVIVKIDAGCTCRQVDPARLPRKISGKSQAVFPIRFKFDSSSYEKKQYRLEIITNKGNFFIPIELIAFPKFKVVPGYISRGSIGENDESKFTFTYRELKTNSEKFFFNDLNDLVYDKNDFSISIISQKTGSVSLLPNCQFKDTNFEVSIKNYNLGNFRREFLFPSLNGSTDVAMPVVWSRIPFLSTVPDRVIATTHPARVFLNCVDNKIEFTRVISYPTGLIVKVVAPREITVQKQDGYSINGYVELETSDHNKVELPVMTINKQ